MAVPFYFTDQYPCPTPTVACYDKLKSILHEAVYNRYI